MSGIGTKEVKAAGSGSGSMAKSITPGEHKAKINNVSLNVVKFAKGPKTFLNLNLETEPIGEGFEGWQLDKDDASKGTYLGQTATVKSDPFGYEDGKRGNFEFTIVNSVVAFIKAICEEIGSDWCDKVDGKYDTIEEFVEGFNNDAPFKGKFLNWCIGGTQDKDDKGYPKYYLNLPALDKQDRSQGKRVFTNDENKGSLLTFDKAIHVYVKKEAASASNFTPPAENTTTEQEVPWKNGDTAEDPFGLGTNAAAEEDPFAVQG